MPIVYRRKDGFYVRAKAEGFRARSAYKLIEISRRVGLFRPGDAVVDLGAWPGGWMQVAAAAVGEGGRVIGVDLRKTDPLPGAANVTCLCGDIADPEVRAQVVAACAGRADVLLSDLAPHLSGVRARDEARMMALADLVLDLTTDVLRPGGHLVIKLFTTPDTPGFLARLRQRFRRVTTTRPEATRKGSAEMYAVAVRFAGPPWTA